MWQRVCVCVSAYMLACIQAHQTVQASTQKIYRAHLHGGDLGHIDRRAQVQVEEVPEQVPLAGDHVMLVDGSRRGTAHWTLSSIDTVTEGTFVI